MVSFGLGAVAAVLVGASASPAWERWLPASLRRHLHVFRSWLALEVTHRAEAHWWADFASASSVVWGACRAAIGEAAASIDAASLRPLGP